MLDERGCPPIHPFAGDRAPVEPTGLRAAAERRAGPEAPLPLAGADLLACPEGALFWPAENLLVVADLHLEKGSAFAARGVFLPPYDTAVTLARLAALLARLNPRRVVALGDSFHDGRAGERIAPADRAALAALQRGRDWVWVDGNHDAGGIAGLADTVPNLEIGPLSFRHEPSSGGRPGEIAGHLHPAARVVGRGGSVRRRCFASDGRRAVLPAFGAFAGGLNVRDPALAALFVATGFVAHVLGAERVYAVPRSRLAPG